MATRIGSLIDKASKMGILSDKASDWKAIKSTDTEKETKVFKDEMEKIMKAFSESVSIKDYSESALDTDTWKKYAEKKYAELATTAKAIGPAYPVTGGYRTDLITDDSLVLGFRLGDLLKLRMHLQKAGFTLQDLNEKLDVLCNPK